MDDCFRRLRRENMVGVNMVLAEFIRIHLAEWLVESRGPTEEARERHHALVLVGTPSRPRPDRSAAEPIIGRSRASHGDPPGRRFERPARKTLTVVFIITTVITYVYVLLLLLLVLVSLLLLLIFISARSRRAQVLANLRLLLRSEVVDDVEPRPVPDGFFLALTRSGADSDSGLAQTARERPSTTLGVGCGRCRTKTAKLID